MSKKVYIGFFLSLLFVLLLNVSCVFADDISDRNNYVVYPNAAYKKGIAPPVSSNDYAQDNTNPATGSYSCQITDLYLKGRNGLDFSLNRYYNLFDSKIYEIYQYTVGSSRYENRRYLTYNDRRFNLGSGWAFDIPTIETGYGGWPILHYGSAGIWRTTGYDSVNNCYYFDDYTQKDVILRCDFNGEYSNGQYTDTFILEKKDGKKLYFAVEGMLIGEKDRFGNEIKYQYNDRIIYDNMTGCNENYPLLSKVIDSVGREINFNYSTNSLTVQITDGTTTKSITYNMARIVDKLGNNMNNIIMDNEYVLDNFFDIEQKTTSYSYEYKSTKESFVYRPVTDTQLDGIGVDNAAVCLYQITYPSGLITSNITYKYTKNCGDTGSMTFYKIFNTMDTYRTGSRQNAYMYRRDYSDEFDGYPYTTPHGTITLIAEVTNGTSHKKYTYNSDLLCTFLSNTGDDHREEVATEYTNRSPSKIIHKIYNPATENYITNIENYTYNEYRDLIAFWDSQNDRDANNMPVNDEHKTTRQYDAKYHYVTSILYKKDASTTITEINQPSADEKTIDYSQISENGVVKKKVQYLYDSYGNITEKRDYFGDWVNYIATKYSYDDNIPARAGKFNGLYMTRKHNENVKDADANQVEAKAGNNAGVVDEIYTYDWFGNMTDTYDRTGNHTHFNYDLAGRVINETLPDNNHKTYAYTVSSSENSTLYTDERDTQLKYYYDECGNLLNEQDIQTGQYLNTYTYDNKFRIKTENNHNTSNNSREMRYEYYSDDKLKTKSITDKNGNTLYYESNEYDNAYLDTGTGVTYQKITKTVWTSPYMTFNTYINKYGQVEKSEQVHNDGSTSKNYSETYKYDYLGNITDVKTARANDEGWAQPYTTHYDYNFAGKIIKTTDIKGKYTTTDYDALGRVVSLTDAKGNQSNPIYSTSYLYDGLGRVIQESIPFSKDGSGVITYTVKKHYYDRNGNIILDSITSNMPNEATQYNKTAYEYNNRNLLTRVTTYNNDAPENYTQYYYDAAGNKLRMYTGLSSPLTINSLDSIAPGSDTTYITTKYEYDRFGKMTKKTDNTQPTGKENNYTYDIDGNLIQETDRDGNVINYTYDGLGRTLSRNVTAPDGSGNAVYSYTYTKLGSKLTMSGGGIDTTYTYDDMGRLITETNTNGIVKSYTYDADNNRKSFTVKQNDTTIENTTYDYDNMDRLYKVYKNGQLVATYTYDDNGNRDTLTYNNNGIWTKYDYSLANRLLALTNKNSAGTILSQFSYNYYLNGNQAIKTDQGGNTTSYTYDGLNRLKSEEATGNPAITYTYDDCNNRKTMSAAGVFETLYDYDTNSRLKSGTKVTGQVTETTSYSYDCNGNQIYTGTETIKPALAGEDEAISLSVLGENAESINAALYEYDGFNQLIRETTGSTTVSYTYNGDGLRNTKTVNGVTTLYVWDGDQIALELDGSGNLNKKYTRGINLLFSEDANGANRKYYLYNGHGDVVQLTDTTGNVVKSYEYDAFGNEKNIDNNDINPFRYCGEYYDKETSTYYLRARYYDSNIGRFISEDSVWSKKLKFPNGQEYDDPLSLNLYTYCVNNPIICIDPSGNTARTAWDGFVKGMDDYVFGGYLEKFSDWLRDIAGKDRIDWEDYKQDTDYKNGYDTAELFSFLGAIGGGLKLMTAPQTVLITPDGYVITSSITPGLNFNDYDDYSSNDKSNNRPQKGKEFRGGSKKDRDKWYGYENKDFQKWWERKGKEEWGGADIEDSEMAKEVYKYWKDIGQPSGY